MYNKTITHFGKAAAVAMALWLTGCDKDQNKAELPTPITNISVEAKDIQMERVAKALAKRFGEDAAARKSLKAEALKQFDGDYDVLYTEFAKQRPEFGQAVAASMVNTENASQRGAVDAGMAEMLRAIPFLNISVPIHIQEWDADTFSPLVVAIPTRFNERDNTQKLKAYDKEGKLHLLDAQHAPDYPLIVVGPSERIKKDIVADAAFYKNQSSMLSQDQDGDLSRPSGIQTCNRINGQTEYMRGMWMRDLSYYEAYVLGVPEIVLSVKAPTASLNGNDVYKAPLVPPSRSSIDNKVWGTTARLFPWNTSIISDQVVYGWVEEDGGGGSIEVSLEKEINGVTVGVKYIYENDDDPIGTLFMPFSYCPPQEFYSLGGGSAEFHWAIDNK